MWVAPVSKDTLQKCFDVIPCMHTLIDHKNYRVEIFVLLWACIVQVRGNIIITFSTLSFVRTTNFMLVACLVWPENNCKLCYLS